MKPGPPREIESYTKNSKTVCRFCGSLSLFCSGMAMSEEGPVQYAVCKSCFDKVMCSPVKNVPVYFIPEENENESRRG